MNVINAARFISHIRNRHLLLLDLLLLPSAVALAFALRLNQAQLAPYLDTMLLYGGAAIVIKIPIFIALGFYSRYWRYAGIDELLLLASGVFVGSLVQGTIFLLIQTFAPQLIVPAVPRSIPSIELLTSLVMISAPRLALQVWARNSRRVTKATQTPPTLQRVLIAGAGEAGAMVLRELRANPQTGLIPLGFVDDDPSKLGVLIQRTRVLGDRHAIPELVRKLQIDQMIIAMPGVSGKAVRGILDICNSAGVQTRIIPGLYELIAGGVNLQQIRDIQIEDLLRRAPVKTDTDGVRDLIRGKRVLVTGAGGSIGSELCRQIVRCAPAELIILGHGENSIFEIANELGASGRSPTGMLRDQGSRDQGQESGGRSQGAAHHVSRITAVIADVRDPDRLAAVFAAHRPEIVFHAAAHKHVPLMEDNVEDAVTNNVLGTRRLVEASIAAEVAHFVLVSTDKAVNPSSVMGVTKRVAELVVQDAAQRTGRAFVAVRFGNVLGSRGSVVPFFQRQIAAGGPVTVTHPDVKRYFMTIPEAVQLVLQAAALGCGGEIFVLDMGAPVRIADLARDLIRLSGLEPGRDIEIRYTGLRPGEKLFEELFGAGEVYGQTRHEKIFVYRNGHADRADAATTNPSQAAPDVPRLASQIDALILAAQQGSAAEVRCRLNELVPEFQGEDTATR